MLCVIRTLSVLVEKGVDTFQSILRANKWAVCNVENCFYAVMCVRVHMQVDLLDSALALSLICLTVRLF